MFVTIKNKFKSLRSGLTHLNQQPIGKAVLAIVLFLDVFILTSIFEGLYDHTRQLVTPYERIPQDCRDIVIDQDWNESNQLSLTAKLASTHYRNSTYNRSYKGLQSIHPICVPIAKKIQAIKSDKELSKQLAALTDVKDELSSVQSDIDDSKGVYDTSLFEVMAKQESKIHDTDSLKNQLSKKINTLNSLTISSEKQESELLQNSKILDLFIEIKASEVFKDELLEDLRTLNFWYPVKRLGMELLFLLPLIIIFFIWNSKSIASNRAYQSLVSSHLLVIVFIPVIFKIIELVYEILPKKFLKNLIEFLESFNLIGLWHYGMMALSIAAAMLLIYIMQKKIFSQEKITQKRIIKGECQSCGIHLPADSQACISCGFAQYKSCHTCNQNTYVFGKHCKECGVSE